MAQWVLLVTILLTGLMAGLHFGNIVGYLPAFKRVTAAQLVPYWKKADEYFGTRMPWFGNLLLLSLITAIILLWKQGGASFWLIMCSLLLVLADLFIIITMNAPVNRVLRALPADMLPDNFEVLRAKALKGFYGRATLSMFSFIVALAAYAFY